MSYIPPNPVNSNLTHDSQSYASVVFRDAQHVMGSYPLASATPSTHGVSPTFLSCI